jgi:hypothetical protein
MTVVFAAVFVLLLAPAVEVCARWWIRRQAAYHVFPPGLRLRLHPDRDTFPELEPIVRFEINREGERGREVPRLKRSERLYRILVAGGSQPEGYLLDQDTTWPGALQCLLAQPHARHRLGASAVHVGCIGRSGIGAQGLDLVFARTLPRYRRLDAIMILVGASDVFRWLEVGAPPAPPPPVRASEVFRCHPEGAFGWTPSQLAAGELVRRASRRWFRPVQIHSRAGRWIGRARAMRARAQMTHTDMPDPAPMLSHFETYLRSAIERASTCADRVIVMRQPWFGKSAYTAEEISHMWHGGVGRAWHEQVTAYYSLEVMSMLMTRLDRVAARVARELAVEQIDLMPILDCSLDTYYDLVHLTPTGAQIVAAAAAAAILGDPILSPGTALEGLGPHDQSQAILSRAPTGQH